MFCKSQEVPKDLKKKYSIQEIKMGAMVVEKTTYDGVNGKKTGMRGEVPLSAEEIKQMDFEASLLIEETEYLKEGFNSNLVGATKKDGVLNYIIETTDPFGNTRTEYYNSETGLKSSKIESEETPQGPMTITLEYLEYKEVNGIKVPSKMIQSISSQVMNIDLVYFDTKKKFDKSYLED